MSFVWSWSPLLCLVFAQILLQPSHASSNTNLVPGGSPLPPGPPWPKWMCVMYSASWGDPYKKFARMMNDLNQSDIDVVLATKKLGEEFGWLVLKVPGSKSLQVFDQLAKRGVHMSQIKQLTSLEDTGKMLGVHDNFTQVPFGKLTNENLVMLKITYRPPGGGTINDYYNVLTSAVKDIMTVKKGGIRLDAFRIFGSVPVQIVVFANAAESIVDWHSLYANGLTLNPPGATFEFESLQMLSSYLEEGTD